MRLKIDLYRRMSRVESFDQVQELRQELRDRFGELPKPVERLLALTELKMDAAVWTIQGIYVEDKFIVFKYASATRMSNSLVSTKNSYAWSII